MIECFWSLHDGQEPANPATWLTHTPNTRLPAVTRPVECRTGRRARGPTSHVATSPRRPKNGECGCCAPLLGVVPTVAPSLSFYGLLCARFAQSLAATWCTYILQLRVDFSSPSAVVDPPPCSRLSTVRKKKGTSRHPTRSILGRILSSPKIHIHIATPPLGLFHASYPPIHARCTRP